MQAIIDHKAVCNRDRPANLLNSLIEWMAKNTLESRLRFI